MGLHFHLASDVVLLCYWVHWQFVREMHVFWIGAGKYLVGFQRGRSAFIAGSTLPGSDNRIGISHVDHTAKRHFSTIISTDSVWETTSPTQIVASKYNPR
jgi:hypothetical protein